MKVIMPSGVSTLSDSGVVPLACYCGTAKTFSTANLENGKDSCWHCGCSCDMVQDGGTWTHAQVTFHTSSL